MPTPVGLDLSLTSTGWSCGDNRTVIAIKEKGPARLVAIRDRLVELLAPVTEPVVALEGYSFASRNSRAHAIGELGGVVRVLLHEAHIPYVEIPPTSRAKFATGKGNAGKSEVVSAISARTGLVWAGAGADDCCDAFILEEMTYTFLGAPRYEWPKAHVEALDKVDWSPFDRYTS